MRPALPLALLLSGCTDAELYLSGMEDLSADRVGVTGEVCTDDVRDAGFPLKVLLLADTAAGPLFSSYDPQQTRLALMQEAISLYASGEAVTFAVAQFDSRAGRLAPIDDWFSSNPGALQGAISQLALPGGCLSGVCRSYEAAFDLARAIIEGDLADMTAGERLRTRYAVALITAGLPDPLPCAGAEDQAACAIDAVSEAARALREDVEAEGALSLQLHALMLAAEDNPDELALTEAMLEEVAFRGGGRFERFDAAAAFTLDRLGLRGGEAPPLEIQSLLVTNRSAAPSPDGALPDTDGDGLEDAAEGRLGGDVTRADTDDDGVGDFVEEMISGALDVPEPLPSACSSLSAEAARMDDDRDGLNNCEEALLGTDASLPDTDGDGMPDLIEVTMGTDYLYADPQADGDWDGAADIDEIRIHTDPRSSDANDHLTEAYRYAVTDLGIQRRLSAEQPALIGGVTIDAVGTGTAAGVGALRYDPSPPRLRWRDARDSSFGDPVEITAPGPARLPSASGAADRWAEVTVAPAALPAQAAEELLLVEASERRCQAFTVRNIHLQETRGGVNDIYLYISQTPAGRRDRPGLYRAMHLPVTYLAEEDRREPADPLILVEDADFTTIGD